MFGFKDIILYRNCSQPNALVLNTHHPWPVYANPGILLLLYYTVATLVKLRRRDARVRGCEAELHPMPDTPHCSACPTAGMGGTWWRGGGGQGVPVAGGTLRKGMRDDPAFPEDAAGALSRLLPFAENHGTGTAAGQAAGEGAGGAGELAQGHGWRG